MPVIQFERLRTDIENLETYEQKLKKKGKTDLLKKFMRRKNTLKPILKERWHAKIKGLQISLTVV